MTTDKPLVAQPVAEARDLTPMAIYANAVAEGKMPADALRVIAELAWKDQDRQAVRAFNEALAAFHEACPPIKAETYGKIMDREGVKIVVDWWYTKLPKLAAQVRPVLKEFGFTFSFDTKLDGGVIEGSCTLKHVLGHEQTSRSYCPTESSNRTSPAHKWTAAESNAKRRALIDVLGVTPQDEPDENTPADLVTEDQARELDTLIASSGASLGKFLHVFDVETTEQMPARKFAAAKQMLIEKASR